MINLIRLYKIMSLQIWMTTNISISWNILGILKKKYHFNLGAMTNYKSYYKEEGDVSS